jgi:hypothetical protein
MPVSKPTPPLGRGAYKIAWRTTSVCFGQKRTINKPRAARARATKMDLKTSKMKLDQRLGHLLKYSILVGRGRPMNSKTST